jgi:O-succinylbenzoic acid--CoA ligase
MNIVAVDHRIVRRSIDPRGAARGLRSREAVIIIIRTDTSLIGLGEAAPLPGMSIDTIYDAIAAADALAARVPFAIHSPHDASTLADHITMAPAAQFAIETALLTLFAQERKTSVASLLAPTPQRILENAVVVDTEEEARRATARCLKIKVGPTGDIDRIRRMAAAAPHARLRLDANRSWSRAETPALIESLRNLPIDYIEEPCPNAHELLTTRDAPPNIDPARGTSAQHGDAPHVSTNIDIARGATSRAPLPRPLAHRIALDESLIELDRADLLRALASPQLAALVLKPTLLGGFAKCLELAALAQAHGVAAVVTHTLEGAVGFAACIELARAIAADVPVGLARPAGAVRTADGDADLDAQRDALETGSAPISPLVARPPGAVRTADGDAERDPLEMGSDPISPDPMSPLAAAATGRRQRARRTARVVVATHTEATVEAIRAAWRDGQPIALLHAKAAPAEIARQRRLLDTAEWRDDDALVLFTSGSTGPARGVVHTRASLAAAARASESHLGWRDNDAWLCCLPLAHAGGASIILRCLLGGKRVILADDPRAIEHATIASLVPTQLAALLDDSAWRPSVRLRAVLLGGAAAPRALVDRALARGVPVLSTYGLTETFGQVATAREPGALPTPLVGVSISGGTADEPALLRIESPSLASRYLDGEVIAPSFVTADLGFVDGVVHVVGRADDVIITGGENVHPNQVEAVLARTRGVREAVAFGIADARWGQVVAVAVARAPGWDRDAAFVEWHASLPPHARPRRLVELDALPRLPSGKVDRRSLSALPSSPVEYR